MTNVFLKREMASGFKFRVSKWEGAKVYVPYSATPQDAKVPFLTFSDVEHVPPDHLSGIIEAPPFRFDLHGETMTKMALEDFTRLENSVKYYHWALDNYAEFAKTERKPRTKLNLQKRLTQLEKEVQAAKRA